MKFSLLLPVLSVLGLNNIIIDTDPGVDDVMALLMALGHKDTNIVAITTVYGNAVVRNVTRNLVSVFHALDLQAAETGKEKYQNNGIPRVAIGAFKPLEYPIYTAGYFHGFDGLGNLTLTYPKLTSADYQDYFAYNLDKTEGKNAGRNCHHRNKPIKKTSHRFVASPNDAADEILHQLEAHPPLTLTIVALGPLTNVALAIQRNRKTMSRVKRIVVMGGSLLSVGNVSPMAEFNFYADPHAVNAVFDTTRGFDLQRRESLLKAPEKVGEFEPIHVTLVPANITHTTLMTRKKMFTFLNKVNHQPIPTFFTNMLTTPLKRSDKIGGLALHDPLAMGVAMGLIHPPPTTTRYFIEVIDDSERGRGICIIDQRPKSKAGPTITETSIEVVEGVGDPSHFQETFLKSAFPQQSLN